MRLLKISVRACASMHQLIALLSLFYILSGAMSAGAAELPLVRANYAAISGAFAPLWIATEKGLFTKHGLNVDLRYIAPATATQALLAKNLDIINPGGEIVEGVGRPHRIFARQRKADRRPGHAMDGRGAQRHQGVGVPLGAIRRKVLQNEHFARAIKVVATTPKS